jgi:hypothetical protein
MLRKESLDAAIPEQAMAEVFARGCTPQIPGLMAASVIDLQCACRRLDWHSMPKEFVEVIDEFAESYG